jgi:hypothetical protein
MQGEIPQGRTPAEQADEKENGAIRMPRSITTLVSLLAIVGPLIAAAIDPPPFIRQAWAEGDRDTVRNTKR